MKVVFDDEHSKQRVAEKVEGPKENKVQKHIYCARPNNEGTRRVKATHEGKRRETKARTGYGGVLGKTGPEKSEAINAIKQARGKMLENKKRTDSHNTAEEPKISTKETCRRKEIKCYYTSACSLRNKINKLAQIVDENSIDIYGITKTCVRQEHNDAEFDIEGFQLYRKDNKSGYGGVIMYVNNKMGATVCEELTSDEFEESAWCMIDTGDNH